MLHLYPISSGIPTKESRSWTKTATKRKHCEKMLSAIFVHLKASFEKALIARDESFESFQNKCGILYLLSILKGITAFMNKHHQISRLKIGWIVCVNKESSGRSNL